MINPTADEKTIHRTFENIHLLYEQISRILIEMDSLFEQNSFYPHLNNQNAICRWRSDLISETYGWMVGGIVRSYYYGDTENDENNNKQIVININLIGKTSIPLVSFGVLTYSNKITDNKFGIGDHWKGYWPFIPRENKDFEFNSENEWLINSRPITDKATQRYNGLRSNLFGTLRLFDIKDNDSLRDLVVIPSIRLFNLGAEEMETLDLSKCITTSDYLDLIK